QGRPVEAPLGTHLCSCIQERLRRHQPLGLGWATPASARCGWIRHLAIMARATPTQDRPCKMKPDQYIDVSGLVRGDPGPRRVEVVARTSRCTMAMSETLIDSIKRRALDEADRE